MKRKTSPITERQIQQALRQFRRCGGQIKHLRDQPTPRRESVALPWEATLGLAAGGAVHVLPLKANTEGLG